jgi:hypothetical protein
MRASKVVKLELSGKRGESKFALIDEEVYNILTKDGRRWYVNKGGYGYSGSDLMHRFVMKLRYGEDQIKNRLIDHVDGNRLHNTYENLRISDSKANAKNRTTKNKNQLYEGVHEMTPQELVDMKITGPMYYCKLKKIIIYVHRDPKMCALCYDSVINYIFGPGKRLNDNRSKEPISMLYWNFSSEIMTKLDKMKASHTDLRGVSKSGDHWKSKITLNLGYFDSPEEAARMYDLASLAFGTENTLNFGEESYSAKDVSTFMQIFFGKLM